VSRRLPPRRRLTRPQWAISVAVGLGIIGFVGAAQWNSALTREEFITSAQRVLTSEAEQLQRQQETLRAEIEAADARVQTFQEADAGSQAVLSQLNEALLAARLATGLDPVRGPGVVIEIADSQRPVPGAGGPAERIVATTSVDGAGPAILVNSARLSPPYRIEAIGPAGLHDRFLSHPSYLARVARRIEAYGLQFASEPRDEIELPAFIGNTRLRWGAPVVEPEP
jgi:uncharacterized protein YlxW (UPF0749 family)